MATAPPSAPTAAPPGTGSIDTPSPLGPLSASPSAASTIGSSCPVPPAVQSADTSTSAPPLVPLSGTLRQRWMQERLVTLLREDTVPSAVRLGATSPMLVELFERVTQQPFTDTPGSHLTSRIRSMGRVLRDVLAAFGSSFSPPLATSTRQDYVTLNRFPRCPCPDIHRWRQRVAAAEQYQTPQLRPHQLTATQDPHLHLWVHGHRHLAPTDNVREWEPSAALLLLWEVDHGQAWPTTASQRSGALAGLTKRLTQQVLKDDELKLWFSPVELQRPLSPGLGDSHQMFWPVRVRPPAPLEPQGWYEDFVARWRAYIATLAVPLGVAAALPASTPVAEAPAVSPSGAPKRRRATPATSQAAARPGVRPREEPAQPQRPAKRQRDIRSFFGSQPPESGESLAPDASPLETAGRHGRAQQGPPT